MKLFGNDRRDKTPDAGEIKRREITDIVRKSTKKRNLLLLGIEWDTHLYDGSLSRGHITLGRHGNIISLYTWTKKRKSDYPLPGFMAVEVSLLDFRHERFAYELSGKLSRHRFNVGISTDYAYRMVH